MQTNLAPSYLAFVDSGASLEQTIQEIIDRAQYHEGAIDALRLFLRVYEAPFEMVDTDHGRIRKLKASFQKNEPNEAIEIDAQSNSGNNYDEAV